MYSLTQAGNLTALAGAIVVILQMFDITVPAESVMTVLSAIAIVAGPIISWYGRQRIGDLTPLGARANTRRVL